MTIPFITNKKRMLGMSFIIVVILFLFPQFVAADDGVMGSIGNVVGNAILGLIAMIAGLTGSLLDTVVEKLIYEMGDILGDPYGLGGAVTTLWTIIRDVCNLAFIFGLVYIGIQTILDSEGANTKRMLASLIIAALLINFSLFFAKAIIDAGNIFAVKTYELMLGEDPAIAGEKGVSGAFMTTMGILTIYKTSTDEKESPHKPFAFYIVAAIFIMVTAFVFGAGALLLINRFIILLLLMIFSPILFAATVFPKTASQASKLWSLLINYSIFAPIYLFFLYLSLIVLKASPYSTSMLDGDSFSKAITGGSSTVVLHFFIATALMIISLVAAKQVGIAGAGGVIKAGHATRRSVQRGAGRATAGTAAVVGRNLAGRGANKIANNKKLKDWGAKKGIGGTLARATLAGGERGANASYDVRNVAGVGKKLNIGEGQKGGYVERKERRKKEDAEVAKKRLGEVPEDDAKVMIRQAELDKVNTHIRHKEEEKSNEKDTGKKQKLSDEIEELKKSKTIAENNVEQEKNRRVLGSTFTTGETERELKKLTNPGKEEIKDANGNIIQEAEFPGKLEAAKKRMKKAAEDYGNATDEAGRKLALARIESEKELVAKTEKEIQKIRIEGGVEGYADVVETRGFVGKISSFTNKGINKESGKNLRDTHSKKIKGVKTTEKPPIPPAP